MKLLIADDEQPARQWLNLLVQDMGPAYEVVGEAATGREVIEFCRTQPVDVVLMDIGMPEMDGLEAAAQLLDMDRPPAVIFTTAYDAHALAAFEHQALDYLLKPVRAERLARALERAQVLSQARLRLLQRPDSADSDGRISLCVQSRGSLHSIPVEEILYFRAESKYVTVRHQGGEALLEESLKSLEREFGDRFMRIHRNALVSKMFLSGLERYSEARNWVRLRGCEVRLEVSRRHLPVVRQWLKLGHG